MLEEEFARCPKHFGVILHSGRFDQVGVGSQIVSFVYVFLQTRRAYNHRQNALGKVMLSEPFEKLKPIKLWHFEIHEHHIRFWELTTSTQLIDGCQVANRLFAIVHKT